MSGYSFKISEALEVKGDNLFSEGKKKETFKILWIEIFSGAMLRKSRFEPMLNLRSLVNLGAFSFA